MNFCDEGEPRLGIRFGQELAPCSCSDDLVTVLGGGPDRLLQIRAEANRATRRLKVENLQLLPPILRCGKIVCLGLNYVDHATESGLTPPDYPIIFLRSSTSLVAHRASLIRPRNSQELDYEGELVAVVGRRTRHVDEEHALTCIAGYSIFNDGSIRDYQLRTSQWTLGKNFDATGGFGPEFVTADELPAGASGLRIQTRLNGVVMQDANTEDMIFGVAKTLALLSACMTLDPGDLLVMGTPSGVGASRQPPVWMKSGDSCEVEIEGIGILRNTIEAES
jgi:2-keto-4-pentenoate hydratase/2-oxohepta-3-ene-1,7-dioic acid hydratase in catechol pathway